MIHKGLQVLILLMLYTAISLFGLDSVWAKTEQVCRFMDLYSTYYQNGREYYQQGSGSVFRWKVDSRKYVITSAHVVAGAARVRALCNGQWIDLKPLGQVDKHDVAVLAPTWDADSLAPLFDLPQDGTQNLDRTYRLIALTNSFFYKYKSPDGRTNDHIGGEYRNFNPDLGVLYLPEGASIWNADNSGRMFFQLGVDPEWRPLWELKEMGFIYFGIQPGMSGSAVIQLAKNRDLIEDGHQALVGIVSRSKYLSSFSAFVSAETINQDLDVLMGRARLPESSLTQKYEFTNGELQLNLKIRENARQWNLSNICSPSSDFVMTSAIREKPEVSRSGGGDWGEGGGGAVSKNKNYFMDEFLGTTAMIPQENCEAKGINANDKYLYLFRGHPLNSIDDLVLVKRDFPEISYTELLEEASLKKNHQEAWCSSDREAPIETMDCNFARPLEFIAEQTARYGRTDEIRQPLCIPSKSSDFNVACPNKNQGRLVFSENSERNQIYHIQLDIEGKIKRYSVKIGSCEQSGTIEVGNPVTTLIKTRFGRIMINKTKLNEWKIQLNDIAQCGLPKPMANPQIFTMDLSKELKKKVYTVRFLHRTPFKDRSQFK